MMTREQQIAMKHICFDAEETTHRRFSFLHPLGHYSTILTLNVGME